MFLSPFHISEGELISIASNIRGIEGNPKYDEMDFFAMYPQFKDRVPSCVLIFYIKLALNTLSYSRWKDSWSMGLSLFIAHHITLYLMSTAGLDADSPIQRVISKSLAAGLTASKSAGSLSKSYDYGSINEDFTGLGTWKLTLYGQQFATMAKLMGKGGSYIW